MYLVDEKYLQQKEVWKMGSLACIGCSKMISLKDGQLTEFKIHMMDTNNFFKEINSVINVAL